ncbi:MAG: HigA family addiction module antidote protein [Thiotrichales bacterium]|nr:MAG: HigA family addiction module antidote protein [Thiotrichales bacterium]
MAWQHPGKTLFVQFLQPRKLSQNRLARAIGVPPRRINEIILGKRAITADTAVRLGRYFGNEPGYWMKLQTDYDIALATNNIGIRLYAINQDDSGVVTGDTREPEAPRSTARKTTHNNNIRRRLLR